MTPRSSEKRTFVQVAGLLLGPIAAVAVWSIVNDPANLALGRMAAVAVLMAVWWMTEAIPLAATALLPIALYPLLAIPPYRDVANTYAHPLIFLFLGGFMIALALEETGLHRRVALSVLTIFGDKPRRVVLGFMLVAAGMSMWISNTATTLMMLPIAVSIIQQTEQAGVAENLRRRFQVALLLGTAYGASIGGIATYVGTPPNVLFKAMYDAAAPDDPISFLAWMLLASPFCVAMLAATWAVLVFALFPVGSAPLLGGSEGIRTQLKSLGKMTTPERRIGVIFLITALLWITRAPTADWGWAPALGVDQTIEAGETIRITGDGTVAILMAILCFVLPSGRPDGAPLATWKMTTRLPWGILLLFGGGFALAAGLQSTGLDVRVGVWMAERLSGLSLLGQQSLIAGGMTFFTELTSNMASVNMLLPILRETAAELNVDPFDLMFPATIAASCAFMLPVATAPNAIVYGSGRVTVGQMVRAGFVLNLISIGLIAGWMAVLASTRAL